MVWCGHYSQIECKPVPDNKKLRYSGNSSYFDIKMVIWILLTGYQRYIIVMNDNVFLLDTHTRIWHMDLCILMPHKAFSDLFVVIVLGTNWIVAAWKVHRIAHYQTTMCIRFPCIMLASCNDTICYNKVNYNGMCVTQWSTMWSLISSLATGLFR